MFFDFFLTFFLGGAKYNMSGQLRFYFGGYFWVRSLGMLECFYVYFLGMIRGSRVETHHVSLRQLPELVAKELIFLSLLLYTFGFIIDMDIFWMEHIYISISIHPSIYLSIHLFIYPSIYPSIHLFIYPSIYPSIYLSIYLSVHLSIYLAITCMYMVCLFVHLSIYSSRGSQARVCSSQKGVSFRPGNLSLQDEKPDLQCRHMEF